MNFVRINRFKGNLSKRMLQLCTQIKLQTYWASSHATIIYLETVEVKMKSNFFVDNQNYKVLMPNLVHR